MTLEGLDLLIAIIGVALTLLIGILSLMHNFANREEDRSKAEQARLRREIINEVKAEIYRDLANWGATVFLRNDQLIGSSKEMSSQTLKNGTMTNLIASRAGITISEI